MKTKTIKRTQIKRFIGSKTRLDIVELFLSQPEQKFYVRELCRELKRAEINGVRRELMNLQSIGLLKRQERGRNVFFLLNDQSPFVDPLRAIFDDILQAKIK